MKRHNKKTAKIISIVEERRVTANVIGTNEDGTEVYVSKEYSIALSDIYSTAKEYLERWNAKKVTLKDPLNNRNFIVLEIED